MSNFIFLDEKQVFELDILKKYGTKAVMTDFALLLGGNQNFKGYSWWWTSSNSGFSNPCIVDEDGEISLGNCYEYSGGVRPATTYSSIFQFISNARIGKDNIFEIEYGEYPQSIVDEFF